LIQTIRSEKPMISQFQFISRVQSSLGYHEGIARRALEYAHDLGEVLYFRDCDLIFLHVAYLLEAFKRVIRSDHEETTIFEHDCDLDDNLDEATFNHSKKSLLEQGDLSRVLLERLWAPLKLSEDEFESLLLLLEKFEVATPFGSGGKKAPRFLVPAFCQEYLPARRWPPQCPPSMMETYRWFQFLEAPTAGLMGRLQVAMCKLAHQYWFAKEGAIVAVDTCQVLLRLTDRAEYATASPHGIVVGARGPNSEAVWHGFVKILSLIDRVLASWPGMNVERYAVFQSSAGPPDCVALDKVTALRNSGHHTMEIRGEVRSSRFVCRRVVMWVCGACRVLI